MIQTVSSKRRKHSLNLKFSIQIHNIILEAQKFGKFLLTVHTIFLYLEYLETTTLVGGFPDIQTVSNEKLARVCVNATETDAQTTQSTHIGTAAVGANTLIWKRNLYPKCLENSVR